ncbi:Fur-regulated basic protein FbpA [Oceanobacillus piezotolerans]|uniref:Fur-regulated basic protein FbpA n=1 Tax=Oceanobacillus piezotolerans TaxID=2448030 RepID=UPI001FE9E704|nr:Fur-regulated basic protein FbpA [Oceanobacillus piezotolerans]
MGEIFRKGVMERRKKLTDILIKWNVYENEESLNDLSLTELEREYKNLILESHPHDSVRSIRWKNNH